MDVFDSIVEKQALMMEAYKDFRDLCEQLKSERANGDSGHSMEYSVEGSVREEMLETPQEELLEQNDERSFDEFPEVQSFCWKDINPDDPGFWTGKSIGIPIAVVVRNTEGQDKLLPIINGRFNTDGL